MQVWGHRCAPTCFLAVISPDRSSSSYSALLYIQQLPLFEILIQPIDATDESLKQYQFYRFSKRTEYEYSSDFQKGLNTNMNTLLIFIKDRTPIRILFGFSKRTEYEYEYSLDFHKWPNTYTNTIKDVISGEIG